MQLLQGAGSLHDVLIVLQAFSGLAQQGLHLQILLEIQITQLDVDLHQVVELLLVLLVSLAQLLHFFCRYGTNGFPFGLQFTHPFEIIHHVCRLGLCEGFHHIEDSLFLGEVLRLLFGLTRSHFCTFGLIFVEQ